MLMLTLTVSSVNVHAEDVRYVTDELEITIHRNMSLNSDIVAQLISGTPVKVLKTNRDEGYVMVATQDKKVGWMLESYLINEPAGRAQHEALKKEYDLLKANFDTQVKERTIKLSTELAKVKNAAKRPLELQQENQKLKKTLEDERAQVEEIKKENVKLAKSSNKVDKKKIKSQAGEGAKEALSDAKSKRRSQIREAKGKGPKRKEVKANNRASYAEAAKKNMDLDANMNESPMLYAGMKMAKSKPMMKGKLCMKSFRSGRRG